jgi:hypothetical protein
MLVRWKVAARIQSGPHPLHGQPGQIADVEQADAMREIEAGVLEPYEAGAMPAAPENKAGRRGGRKAQ